GLPGASAGRVQSPALRMICEREEEILRFEPREYWTIDADAEQRQQPLSARLIEYRSEKVEQFSFTNETQASEVRSTLESAARSGLPGASAGRVQSPALRMICEREEEILRFEPREYWTIDADAEQRQQPLSARLIEYRSEKVEQFSFTNETQASEVRSTLESAANGKLSVANIERKQRRRNPSPPFTTSTLQQEAARKLGFGAQRTMRLAQQLY